MSDARRPLWKPPVSVEVDEEVEFHVEMRTREFVAGGMDAVEARALALRRFGDLGRMKSICKDIGTKRDRDMRRASWWAEFLHDLRFALRMPRSSPGSTAIAVLTLGLGIGATTTIFSALDAVVLRPFPYSEPNRVVLVPSVWQEQNGGASVGNYVDWQARSRNVFEELGANTFGNFTLSDEGEPERVAGFYVTHNYFDVYGARPLRGRLFQAEDDVPGADAVVLISEGLWRRRFGADASLLGREIRVSGRPHRVIGILPQSFDPLLAREELWVPIAFTPEQRADHDNHFLNVIGRLRPGVTVTQAEQHMRGVARELELLYPNANQGRSARVFLLSDFIIGNFRERLAVLLGAGALVLLIACSNVANILLARGAGRAKELAIRAALGAGRGRIIRQLLTESMLLSFCASLFGLALSWPGIQLVRATAPQGIPRIDQLRIDPRVIVFALLLGLLATALFGILPARRAARKDLQSRLREGLRGTSMGSVRDRLRTTLIAGEVAIALTLLVGAGLLIRSAVHLQRIDPGFRSDRVVSGLLTLPESYTSADQVSATFQRIAQELNSRPGIASAAVSTRSPLRSSGNSNGLLPEGRVNEPANRIDSSLHVVTDGYLATLGITLLRGRWFDARDVRGAERVTVISDALAKAAWPGEDALGKRVLCCEGTEDDPRYKTVIGITADVRSAGPTVDPVPEFYLPIAQAPPDVWSWTQRTMVIVARGAGDDPAAAINEMRAVVKRADATLPLYTVAPLREQLRGSLARERFNTMLLGTLGSIGLILALIGIYSVIAYFVTLRTPEVGVRMALGATARDVLLLLTLQGSLPLGIGIAAGIAGAVGATRLLRSSLYGVGPMDPLTFGLVAVSLVLIGLAAIVIPARRATRVDPATTLRAG
jgi:predicted permease